MLILNFSHPLKDDQKAQIEVLTGQTIAEVLDFPVQFDNAKPFETQVRALVDSLALDPNLWQSEAILVNPPSYNFAALTLLAELHGRMGYFPAITRIRPVPDSIPTRYEIAEIINLQAVRDAARKTRRS
jgi:hypothetical protein